MATTGTNEYWMNDFNQPQKSHSSLGTMKNGTKIGPRSPHTALAISPNGANEAKTANVERLQNVHSLKQLKEKLDERRYPTLAEMDEAVPGRPALIRAGEGPWRSRRT